VAASERSLVEEFPGDDLDPEVWFPYYLPHWSSRKASMATYDVGGGELRLSVPPEQQQWCREFHPEPLRVSCIQSGSWSGPRGSTQGQQPFREGLVVREEQPTMWGYTPRYAHIEIRMRGLITPRSMFALWMSGIEDQPERSGEICVAEIFGDAVQDGTVQVGMGVHEFRDPTLREEFATEPLEIDAAEFHTYGVEWRPGSLAFVVDGTQVRELEQSPDYPMQLMIGVFDFPAKATPADADAVPAMVVSRVRGRPLD
jgi:hypothetical protein